MITLIKWLGDLQDKLQARKLACHLGTTEKHLQSALAELAQIESQLARDVHANLRVDVRGCLVSLQRYKFHLGLVDGKHLRDAIQRAARGF